MKCSVKFLVAFFFFATACSHQQTAPTPELPATEHSSKLFAAPFYWVTYSKVAEDTVSPDIFFLINKLEQSFDPDCYYRPEVNGECTFNGDKKLLATLDQLSDDLREETFGAFEVSVQKNGKQRRDFGGLCQGFVLNQLKSKVDGGWYGNFAGDIYVGKNLPEEIPLSIGDPKIPEIDFAKVKMRNGFMLGSSPPQFRSLIRDPKTGDLLKRSDFQRITLFAKPEFEGGRLDGWSTALIVGGKKLLSHLSSLEKYKGLWGYFYIDSEGNVACSENVKCDLQNDKSIRTIYVGW